MQFHGSDLEHLQGSMGTNLGPSNDGISGVVIHHRPQLGEERRHASIH